MYNDWFSIGPLTVHGYGACIAIGLVFALMLASWRGKKIGLNDDIIFGVVLGAVVFGFLGAKILFCIVEWKSFIADPASFLSSSGFVVFGGITGGLLYIILYTKIKKVKFFDYMEICVPSVAIGQAFGRLGCFFAGCCYGRETDSWIGIAFSHSQYAPNGVKLIPTQLLSSVGNMLNAIILIYLSKKLKKKGSLLACYLMFYSVGRFLIEMLRNDERGSVGALSTSQFYGIFSFVVGLILFLIVNLRKTGSESLKESEEKNEEI